MISIPLVAALWENPNFGGRRRVLAKDEPNLVSEGFDNVVSSIGVHPGPSYNEWKLKNGGKEPTVGFYKDLYFGGAALILTTGAYADIKTLFNFNDVISSVLFNPTPAGAKPIVPIPLIVHIFKNSQCGGQETQIVENTFNISDYLGGDWNDAISSAWIEAGPDYTGSEKARFWEDKPTSQMPFGSGGHMDLAVGTYLDFKQLHFNDKTSAIQLTGTFID